MYVWQMNDGRWHVSNLTSVKFDVRMDELSRGYETQADAYAALESWKTRHPDAIQRAW